MRRTFAIATLAAVLLVPAACSDDEPKAGEARLEVDGTALVERADGERETVDDDTDLRSGDRVSMQQGTAVMRLRGGTTFELREGIDAAADTAVLMGRRPVLEAGELLVVTPGTAAVEADGTEVDVTDGAAVVTRAFGMSVSAYDADVALDSAGVEVDVRALREMVVPDLGRPPREPRPVSYDEIDPWDRRYLGEADQMGRELERLAEQLTGLLPDGQGRTVGFFKLVLPGLEDEEDFVPTLLEEIPAGSQNPGETLIGSAITDLGERGSFTDRWDAVWDFRDDGADWGIVALDQAVRSAPLVGTVEEAFNTSFDDLASAPSSPSTPATPSGGTGGTDGGTTDVGTDGATDGGTSPPTTPPPSTPPEEPPDPPVVPPTPPDPPDELAPVVEPVVDLVEELLGGLLG